MHPLAGALVRNRKAEIGGFTSREAHTVPVTLEEDELALYEEITEYIRNGYNRAQAEQNLALGFVMITYQKMLASSSHAIRQSFRRRIEKLRKQLGQTADVKPRSGAHIDDLRELEEMTEALKDVDDASLDHAALLLEIKELEQLVDRLGALRDSKAAELLTALDGSSGPPGEKVVIFTQFIETQDLLAATLRRNGFTVSTFNGQMSLEDKESAVRKFRETDQVLISTEAGGEGRNFQFAHLMVNYDLPWNPMKVEQRIGRLDRIGQTAPVRIYNLYCEGTVEERVLEVLANRIGLFQESVGSLDPILGTVSGTSRTCCSAVTRWTRSTPGSRWIWSSEFARQREGTHAGGLRTGLREPAPRQSPRTARRAPTRAMAGPRGIRGGMPALLRRGAA